MSKGFKKKIKELSGKKDIFLMIPKTSGSGFFCVCLDFAEKLENPLFKTAIGMIQHATEALEDELTHWIIHPTVSGAEIERIGYLKRLFLAIDDPKYQIWTPEIVIATKKGDNTYFNTTDRLIQDYKNGLLPYSYFNTITIGIVRILNPHCQSDPNEIMEHFTHFKNSNLDYFEKRRKKLETSDITWGLSDGENSIEYTLYEYDNGKYIQMSTPDIYIDWNKEDEIR